MLLSHGRLLAKHAPASGGGHRPGRAADEWWRLVCRTAAAISGVLSRNGYRSLDEAEVETEVRQHYANQRLPVRSAAKSVTAGTVAVATSGIRSICPDAVRRCACESTVGVGFAIRRAARPDLRRALRWCTSALRSPHQVLQHQERCFSQQASRSVALDAATTIDRHPEIPACLTVRPSGAPRPAP